jgi:hypothetical protein
MEKIQKAERVSSYRCKLLELIELSASVEVLGSLVASHEILDGRVSADTMLSADCRFLR